MKYLIRMVVVLLAVSIAASCDINQPHEELEPEPEITEKVNVSMIVKDAADSSRITSGKIEFDGGRFTDKVMTTNGIFDDSLKAHLEPVFAFAYADGYQATDTVQIDLSQDVEKTFYLTEKKGDPDPDGPGKIQVDTKCVDGEVVGRIFGAVENGFRSIKLLKAVSREIISEREGFEPTDDQEYKFSDVSNGTYIVIASLDNGSDPSESDPVKLDCKIQKPIADFTWEGYGLNVEFDASDSYDPDGDIVAYEWKFGDGNEGSGIHPTNEFPSPGNYEVTLTVTDDDGLTGETSKEVTVSRPITKSCPLDASDDGTVISFGNERIRSDKTEDKSRTAIEDVQLSPGVYTIKLYGYDEHQYREDQDQPQESYYVSLASDGNHVADTPELDDLADGQTFAEETTVIEDFTIEDAVDAVQGIHPAYPSDNANSLNALCASFKKTQDRYTHRVRNQVDHDVWVNAERLVDTVFPFGHLELIKSSKDPIGAFQVDFKRHLDPNEDDENVRLEFIFDEEGNEKIVTPEFKDIAGADGWTSSSVEMDAAEFAGTAGRIAGIRVRYTGDSSSTDEVYSGTPNEETMVKLTWYTKSSHKAAKMLQPADFQHETVLNN